MNFIVKLFYKPFGIVTALIAARVGKSLFAKLWAKIDDTEPPETTAPSATMTKAVGAKTLEAATLAATAAAADRLGALVFHHLFGLWPGKDPEPAESKSDS